MDHPRELRRGETGKCILLELRWKMSFCADLELQSQPQLGVPLVNCPP